MKKHIWFPFTQMQNVRDLPHAVSAKGSCIYLKNGQAIIDAISSWWVITLGHCEPSIVKAIQQQAACMDQVLFANFAHNPSQELADELQNLLPPELAYLFFSDDGSTAVEVGLKMAMQSWKQRDPRGKRKTFLSFQHSYHGDTVGAMSLSGPSLFNEPYKELLFSVVRARQGQRSSDPVSDYLSDFETKIKKHHAALAGVILEPLVQGAGGMIVWPESAVQEICSLTKKYGLYLIFDEVMTGFGRTGELFAFQKLGVVPDILCLSKGLTGGFLPLALTVANRDIYESFLSQDKSQLFFHGHSFTGNPISCAAAVANIRAIKKQNLKTKWQKISAIHQSKIQQLKDHTNCLDARMCGTIASLELRVKPEFEGYSSPYAGEFTQRALQKGVFLRPIGNIVYILPPYCISERELEQVWFVIEEELHLLNS